VIFSPFPHSHCSRRWAQKEKHARPNAGSARRTAPRSLCCGLQSYVCVVGCEWVRLGAGGRDRADGFPKGRACSMVGRTGSSVDRRMCNDDRVRRSCCWRARKAERRATCQGERCRRPVITPCIELVTGNEMEHTPTRSPQSRAPTWWRRSERYYYVSVGVKDVDP
jgi:hypothetical protein